MKNIILTLLLFSSTISAYSQTNGQILEKNEFRLPDSVVATIKKRFDEGTALKILNLKYYKITYLSDGLKVIAYCVEPKEAGKYPCIISNRGGNRNLGLWTIGGVGRFLGAMASWDYVVIASQYRGNDGGEGIEDFGGKDVNDVLNLIPALGQLPKADTTRIGVEGTSRGGMMTYIALTKTNRFKAAVTTSGLANLFNFVSNRPDVEQRTISVLIPNYKTNKDNSLKERSAVFWADKICKTTPLLIMHGSSDWRVLATESFELVNKLYQYKHPARFIYFEGAAHGIPEFHGERLMEMKRHFDFYVRDKKSLPNMTLHGE